MAQNGARSFITANGLSSRLLSPPLQCNIWPLASNAPFEEGDCGGGGGSRFYPQTVRQMASAAAAELYHKLPAFFPLLVPNAKTLPSLQSVSWIHLMEKKMEGIRGI